VYSLGAILYQMLTGHAPFLAGSAAETMMKVMHDEPKRPRSLHADTPVELETICLKCLEKDPSRRYPTARALAEDAGRFLAGEPVLARPAGLMRRVVSWTRRRPAVLAVLVALVAFVLAGLVFYLVEENAFLRAKQAAPDLVRQRGPRTDAVGMWVLLTMLVTIASVPVLFGFLKSMRRVSWSDLFDPAKMSPMQSAGPRWRMFLTSTGLACATAGVVLLAKLIQAQVWETQMEGLLWTLPFVCLWFGGFMAWFAWMDHRLSMTGTPSRQLAAPQAAAIREAVREIEMGEAVRLYREAVPGASRGEAYQHALRVAAELRAQEPELFEAVATRKLNPFRLNTLPMMICGMIEGIAAYLLLRMLPEQPLAPVVSRFGVAFCYGAALVLMGRARSLATRLLVIAGGIAAGLILLRLFPAPQTPMQGADVFFIGMIFGIAVVICGYFWKRGNAPGQSSS